MVQEQLLLWYKNSYSCDVRTVVVCLDMQNVVFTNQSGTIDERSICRDEPAQSMPYKKEYDEFNLTLS